MYLHEISYYSFLSNKFISVSHCSNSVTMTETDSRNKHGLIVLHKADAQFAAGSSEGKPHNSPHTCLAAEGRKCLPSACLTQTNLSRDTPAAICHHLPSMSSRTTPTVSCSISLYHVNTFVIFNNNCGTKGYVCSVVRKQGLDMGR